MERHLVRRRLCPDMCFFQRATDHPCERITQDPGVQSLRERVQRTMLHSANVTRSRMGITNVSVHSNMDKIQLKYGSDTD